MLQEALDWNNKQYPLFIKELIDLYNKLLTDRGAASKYRAKQVEAELLRAEKVQLEEELKGVQDSTPEDIAILEEAVTARQAALEARRQEKYEVARDLKIRLNKTTASIKGLISKTKAAKEAEYQGIDELNTEIDNFDRRLRELDKILDQIFALLKSVAESMRRYAKEIESHEEAIAKFERRKQLNQDFVDAEIAERELDEELDTLVLQLTEHTRKASARYKTLLTGLTGINAKEINGEVPDAAIEAELEVLQEQSAVITNEGIEPDKKKKILQDGEDG